MAAVKKDLGDLEFMSEVDAALLDKGSPWAYRLSILLLLSFTGFLVWINVSYRNEVTRGEGQITPSLGVQPVQSEQGGIVKEIFVKEGQEVKKGDRLVQMSNISDVAEFQDLLNKQVECQFSLKRLDAEAALIPLAYTEEERAAYPFMVEDQLRLFAARKDKLEGGTREIEATLQQKRLSVQEALSRKTQYEQNLLLLKDQAERVKPLVEQGRYSRIEYLNLRQRVISQEGELNTLAETISRTQSEVREEEARLANRDSEWQATIAAERNDYRKQLDSINQRIAAGSHRVQISDLRAPMNGVIRRILLKEENVAQRAESIMELLPTDDTLEVDARFRPADRGFLEVGMNATIKVDAYDFTIYGGLPAMVTRISPDTIEDSRGQAWYEVRLQTEAASLEYGSQVLEMKPGMTVKVDVISGRKSIFDYLLKPILKSRQVGQARGHTANATGQEVSGEYPALPSAQQTPETFTPAMPAAPAMPDSQTAPGMPPAPPAAAMPDTAPAPAVPPAPYAPAYPDAPAASEAPAYPDAPAAPYAPAYPDAPAASEAPAYPDASAAPYAPAYPDASAASDTPAYPDAPFAPDMPNSPDAPGSILPPITPAAPAGPDGQHGPEGREGTAQ